MTFSWHGIGANAAYKHASNTWLYTQRWPDAGTVCYIMSKAWLKDYKEYVFFNAINYSQKPDPEPDHMEKKHPDAADLCRMACYQAGGIKEAWTSYHM